MKLRLLFLLSLLCFLPALSHAQTAGGVQSINGVPGPFTFGSGSTCVGTTCTFSGGGSLPSGTVGQIPSYPSTGTTVQAINISKIPVEFYGATAYLTEAAAEAGPDDTAHFQSAVTAAGALPGVATCQAGMWYHVEGPVNFTAKEGLVGTSNQTYGGLCNLVSNSASSNILSVANAGSNTLMNLSINRSVEGTGTSSGLYAYKSNGMIVENVQSYDSVRDFYREQTPDGGGATGRWTALQAGWNIPQTTGTYYGFYDDSADGSAMFSVILTNSQAGCQNLTGTAVSYGQLITGTLISDNDTDNFSSAGCTYGQVATYTGTGSGANASDIHWWNSTHDNFGVNAFEVNGVIAAQTGSVEISGGWAVAGPKTSSSTGAVYILNSSGVSVNHVQIGAHAASGFPAAMGVNISGSTSTGNSVVGNTFLNQTNSVFLTNNAVGNTVTGNTAINATGSGINYAFHINNGASYNNVSTNTVTGGPWTDGLYIESGANNNTYVGNNCGSGVTTCVADSGTGNGVTNFAAVALGAKAAVYADSTTGTLPNSYAGYLAYGPVSVQGNNAHTTTAAWSIGFTVPGLAPDTNTHFNVWNSGTWQNAFVINNSTLAATFAGAVTAPSLALNADSAFTSAPRSYPAWHLAAGGSITTATPVGSVFYSTKGGVIERETANLSGTNTCSVAPVAAIVDCGTTATCTSPTTLTSLTTGTTDGIFDSGALSVSIPAGHFFTMEFTAGTCTGHPAFDTATTVRQQ